MLISLIIIIGSDLAFEFLFEKLNQSKLEPFEKIQAKTRYLSKKRVWQCGALMLALVIVFLLGALINMNSLILTFLLGLTLAIINTIFESTVFDQMRNTLR